MRIKKIDSRGIGHYLVMIGIVLTVAVVGTWIRVVSHADTTSTSSTGNGKIQTAVNPPPLTPCVANPHGCGFPDATTAGVTVKKLTASPSITVTTPGTVINGLNVDGSISVDANNVTIENSRVTCGSDCTASFVIRVDPSVTGTTITHITASGNSNVSAVVGGNGPFVLKSSDLSAAEDGVHVVSNTTVQDNYIHDLAPTSTSHDDTIQQITTTADSILIKHNTLLPYNSTTQVYNNSAFICGGNCVSTTHLSYLDNLQNGGSRTLYCPHSGSNNIFSGNRWGRDYNYTSTSVDCFNTSINKFDATNVWDDTNAPITSSTST